MTSDNCFSMIAHSQFVQNVCSYFCVVGQTWTNSLCSFQTQNKDRFEGGPADRGLAELYRTLRTLCISARCHMACSLHKKAECRLLVDKMVIRTCDVQIKMRSDRGAPLAHRHSCSYDILVSPFVMGDTDQSCMLDLCRCTGWEHLIVIDCKRCWHCTSRHTQFDQISRPYPWS